MDQWHEYKLNARKTLWRKIQFSSVSQSCLTLCDPMNCSMPGFPTLHHLLEFPQIHVHWVRDAVQWSHPLPPPFPPVLNLSQHQGLFQWVGFLHQVFKVLELQHQSFQWMFRVNFLYNWLIWSSCSWRDSQESSLAPQFKREHQFFGTQPSLWSNFHICTWPLEKTIALTMQTMVSKVLSLLSNTLCLS